MKSKIKKKIKELNELCDTLQFEFVDDKHGCSIVNHSTIKGHESNSFGVFEYYSDNSNDAGYKECLAFLEGLLAGTRLMDEKSYHNFIAKNY